MPKMPDAATPLSVSLLEATLDQLPIGAIILDDQGIIRRFNRYEEQLSGLRRESTIGKSFFSEVAPCTADIELGPRFHEGIAAGTLDLDIEFSFPYQFNRVPRDVRIRARSVRDADALAHLVLIEDITSRKQLERNNAEMMGGLRAMVARSLGSAYGEQAMAQSALLFGEGDALECEAIAMFAELAGFAEQASRVAPGQLFALLDARLQRAVDIIQRRGGRVDSLSGDGISALFIPDPDKPMRHLYDAARVAHELALDGKGQIGLIPFRVCLAQGSVINGPIGWRAFGERTTVGRPIVWSRGVAKLARPHEVLVTEPIAAQLQGVAALSSLAGLSPQGMADPGTLYRLDALDLPREV